MIGVDSVIRVINALSYDGLIIIRDKKGYIRQELDMDYIDMSLYYA